MMFPRDVDVIKQMLDGNSLDFYLEDDMFEIEGFAHVDGDKIVVDVKDAVRHILVITGKSLEVYMSGRSLCAKRPDTGKVFSMEVNRIYKKLTDPTWQDFSSLLASGEAEHFFQKESDTLVWRNEDEDRWYIELNKINMYYSGTRKSYETAEQLVMDNREIIPGVWQAVSYSAEVEYEEKAYDEYSHRHRV